jgi:hypothetical protein
MESTIGEAPSRSLDPGRQPAGSNELARGLVSTLPEATLVAQDENGALTGFLDVAQRSHADGCDPAQPVGFIEGWFVQEMFRGRTPGHEESLRNRGSEKLSRSMHAGNLRRVFQDEQTGGSV